MVTDEYVVVQLPRCPMSIPRLYNRTITLRVIPASIFMSNSIQLNDILFRPYRTRLIFIGQSQGYYAITSYVPVKGQ